METGFFVKWVGVDVAYTFDAYAKYPKLVDTILSLEWMTNDEKNYWLKHLEKMSNRNRASLQLLLNKHKIAYKKHLDQELLEERKALKLLFG